MIQTSYHMAKKQIRSSMSSILPAPAFSGMFYFNTEQHSSSKTFPKGFKKPNMNLRQGPLGKS